MTEKRNIPAAAFHLTVGEFALGDNGDGAKTAPIKMVARSGKPIEHWYWGRVVHDLAGMKLHKHRLPIDYCHDHDQIIGYLNKFESESGDLVCSGALVPYGDDDRATEIIHKSSKGVPYEASINFGGGGIKIEELSEGQVAQVNGYQLEGPAAIIREWPLRGVAVCPYGADQNTSSQFAQSGEVAVTVLSQTQTQEKDMTDEQTVEAAEAVETEQLSTEAEANQAVEAEDAQPTEEADATEQSQPAVEPDEAEQAETETETELSEGDIPGKQFMDTFGERQGAVYFAKGMSFEQALREHMQFQQSRIQELETKLAQRADRGVDEPVQFRSADDAAKPKGLTGLVTFAAQKR